METISLRITNWENGEIEQVDYSSSIKVPRKQELLNLLPTHLEKLQYSFKFSTGILSTVGHSIVLCIFREYNEPKLGILISIEKQQEKIVEVKMIDANFVALDQASIEYSLSRANPPRELGIQPGALLPGEAPTIINEFWISTCGWHDETAMIFLTFHVTCRYPPQIINEEEDSLTQTSSIDDSIPVSEYFLSEKFSDLSIHCQTTKFPVHKIILASRVKYFESMLSSDMREVVEAVVRLDDMEPATCKEFLRFIYQRKVNDLGSFVNQLFEASDKYGMDDLRCLCERYLFSHLNRDNALEVYDLSRMHASPTLAKRAKEIIFGNKKTFASDPETLKRFTCKYPDLVFQLFEMS